MREIKRGAAGEIDDSYTQDFGVSDGSDAKAGEIGEYKDSLIPLANAVPLVTDTPKDMTFIDLTPGDWDVSASFVFSHAPTTSLTHWSGGPSLVSNTHANFTDEFSLTTPAIVPGAGEAQTICSPTVRISVGVNTRIYFVAHAIFSVAALSVYGEGRARRVR